jgi:hypothetical protein
MKSPIGGKKPSTYEKKYFTGLVKARPVCVNPSNEDYKKHLGYEPKFEKEYYNRPSMDGTSKSSRLVFLMEFNPYEQMGVNVEEAEANNWPKKVNFEIELRLEKKERINANGDKQYFFNKMGLGNGLEASWGTSVEEVLNKKSFAVRKEIIIGDDTFEVDVVPSKVGEPGLLNFLYCMYDKRGSKANPVNMDILETDWDDICDGDIEEIQTIFDLDETNEVLDCFRDGNGQPREIGVLLGIEINKKGYATMKGYIGDTNYYFTKVTKRGWAYDDYTRENILKPETQQYLGLEIQNSVDFKEYIHNANIITQASSMPDNNTNSYDIPEEDTTNTEVPF